MKITKKKLKIPRKCAVGDRVALILITTRPSGTQPTNFELSFTVECINKKKKVSESCN